MTAAPKISHITPKQHAADVANLRKARAALKGRPRTAKQKAASRRNLVVARATQKSRAAQKASSGGKTPAPRKPVKAPLPANYQRNLGLAGLVPSETAFSLYLPGLPVCGPAALAEHLAIHTGAIAEVPAILELWRLAGDATLGDLLECAAEHGLAGNRVSWFERCDPDYGEAGLIYGVQLSQGYHAALAAPGGMISWCMLVPRDGTPEEAWWVEWEGE
jgi:hypothetical protein